MKKASNDASVCNFTLAVNRPYKSQQADAQNADFINCVAWNQPADYLASYAKKGTIVSVEGRINTRSYDGANGKVYVTEVRADNVQIISDRNTTNQNIQGFNSTVNNQTFTPDVQVEYEDNYEDDFNDSPSLNITEDDLPFY